MCMTILYNSDAVLQHHALLAANQSTNLWSQARTVHRLLCYTLDWFKFKHIREKLKLVKPATISNGKCMALATWVLVLLWTLLFTCFGLGIPLVTRLVPICCYSASKICMSQCCLATIDPLYNRTSNVWNHLHGLAQVLSFTFLRLDICLQSVYERQSEHIHNIHICFNIFVDLCFENLRNKQSFLMTDS